MPKGAETPITIYEIAGIGGPYNVALEDRDDAMVRPESRFRVRVQEVRDGASPIGGLTYGVLAFSKTGLEIEANPPLKVFDSVRIRLDDGSDQLRRAVADGMVTPQPNSRDRATRIRFTSVPPEFAGYLEGLRRR